MPRTKSEMHERLEITDTFMEVCHKLSEGNPGALALLCSINNAAHKVDTILGVGAPGLYFMRLDVIGIYGSRIVMLWRDVCGEKLYNLIAVLRAHQFGDLTREQVLHAIENRGEGIDMPAVLKKVQEQLGPRFVAAR